MLQSRLAIIDRQGAQTRLRQWRNGNLPEPRSAQPDLLDVRDWQRASRQLQARLFLRLIPRTGTTHVATAIGVTPRAVNYWRAGHCTPNARHWRQLAALRVLLSRTQI
jgi:hypothetical protein